jgi:hypothetical protein
MTYDFEAVVDVASAYKLDADDLDQFANAINHELLFHTSPLPKLSDDPIPELTRMAQSLLAGCRASQEFARLEATAQAYAGKDFIDSGDYIDELLVSLEQLARLLTRAPKHGGERPLDVGEFFIVHKLCRFWETHYPNSPVTEKFVDGEARSAGGAFVSDMIECIIVRVRPFRKGSTAFDTSNKDTVEIRGTVITQIRNYLKEKRAPQKMEQQTPPTASA